MNTTNQTLTIETKHKTLEVLIISYSDNSRSYSEKGSNVMYYTDKTTILLHVLNSDIDYEIGDNIKFKNKDYMITNIYKNNDITETETIIQQ